MSNDSLTFNGVPTVFKSHLPTDEGDVKTYVRNIRPGDNPADVIFLPEREPTSKTKLYVPTYLVKYAKKVYGDQFEIVVITKLSECYEQS